MWILCEQGNLINLALHKTIAKHKESQGDKVTVRTDDGVHIATLPSEHHADELIEELALNIMKGTSCIDLGIRIRQLQQSPPVRFERQEALGCGIS